MLSTAAGKATDYNESGEFRSQQTSIVTRKIWLPKFFYDALPAFYLLSGISAFFATLYINEWFWVVPHYLLFSIACVHIGIFVYRRRRRNSVEQPDS